MGFREFFKIEKFSICILEQKIQKQKFLFLKRIKKKGNSQLINQFFDHTNLNPKNYCSLRKENKIPTKKKQRKKITFSLNFQKEKKSFCKKIFQKNSFFLYYQTEHKISPPTPKERASRSVKTPIDVERI